MTTATYPKFKQAALEAVLALGTPKAVLVDTALYTYSSAHQFFSSIAAGARVGAPVVLSGVTATEGVLDAADISVTGLTGAPTVEAVAIYVDTGVEATSPLLCFIDNATGLPVAAGRSQVDVTWNGGANRIFRL